MKKLIVIKGNSTISFFLRTIDQKNLRGSSAIERRTEIKREDNSFFQSLSFFSFGFGQK